MEYPLGTKITGTFKGTVISPKDFRHPNFYIPVEGEHSSFYNVHIDKVTVTGQEFPEPANWPPVKGDVWRTKTIEFFASLDHGEILLVPDDQEINDTWTVDEFKRFNPRLIRRRQ